MHLAMHPLSLQPNYNNRRKLIMAKPLIQLALDSLDYDTDRKSTRLNSSH